MGRRAIWLGTILGLTLAASSVSNASAQSSGPGAAGRDRQIGQNRTPLPDNSSSPLTSDPEAYDAIELYSRLCVSTHGDLARATGIIGEGDSAIEKMDDAVLRGLEDGKSGGVGWIIRMPLGEQLLVEFPPGGACIVRAPRVNSAQLEAAFRNLLDQFAASGQFVIRREGEQTKMIDAPPRPTGGKGAAAENPPKSGEKLRYHLLGYSMRLPDTGKKAELALATTDSKAVSIQATLSYAVPPDRP